ncbi:glycogen/starch synthase [Anaerobacillus sp. HL2]|nr:glycogen/starch synthase [Anaerobacillus sp. HL2]
MKKLQTVLMLAWEFPIMVIGGLSRHVYDLSKELVQLGCNIHVITTGALKTIQIA